MHAPLAARNVIHDHVESGDNGNGEKCASDSGQKTTRRDGEHDREWMHLDGRSHDQRLKHVPFNLLHEEHNPEHDHGGNRSKINKRDEHRNHTGQHGTHDRDERAKEDGNCYRENERESAEEQSKYPGPEANTDGVNERDEDLNLHEVGQGDPASVPSTIRCRPRGPREQTNGPCPDPAPVDQDEESREEHQQYAGEEVSKGRANRECAGHKPCTVILDRLPGLGKVVVDLHLRQVQWRRKKLSFDTVKELERAVPEIREPADDLGDYQVDEARNDANQSDFGDCDGKPLRPAMPLEELNEGHEKCTKEYRDHKRHHDELQLDDEEDQERDNAGNDENAPRPGSRDTHTEGYGLVDRMVSRYRVRLSLAEHHASVYSREYATKLIFPKRHPRGVCRMPRVSSELMVETISAAKARRIALAAQGFARQAPDEVGARQLNLTIDRLGLLQLDSVNVFERSHYLPVFARLGAYDKAHLDRLTFARKGRYVEYWAHEAALIPVESWPLFRWRMDQYRQRSADALTGWSQANAPLLAWLRAELAEKGPMAASAVEHDSNKRSGPWWGWSDVKTGLETLFRWGEVVSAGRTRFERVYGLAEQLLPREVLEREVPRREALKTLIESASLAHGIGTASDIADYFRLKNATAAELLAELADDGVVLQTRVEGWKQMAWLHRDARAPRRIEATALLSPFDPVVWRRDRAERLFDFHYRIEIYTPEPKRVYGYYSLPILLDDAIVGRIDLKSDRKPGILRVQSAWHEHHANPHSVAERVAPLLRRAAAWQGLGSVEVTDRGNLAKAIAAELHG